MYERQDSNSRINFIFHMNPTTNRNYAAELQPGVSSTTTVDYFPSLEDSIKVKDEKLAAATKAALQSGTLTPLIKEELKYSIQTKRLIQGKGELEVEFTEPEKPELTEEEKDRVEKRREQNRLAAQRFRNKQKAQGNHLTKKIQGLECSNTNLRFDIRKLNAERDELMRQLKEHLQVCPYQFMHK